MKQIKKAFLITMASAGLAGSSLVSCERKLTKIYEVDQTGTVIDSFVTEWPSYMIQQGTHQMRTTVKDTAGVDRQLVPGTFRFESQMPKPAVK